jgi:hypothetical protein
MNEKRKDVEDIVVLLRQRERVFWIKVTAMILFGIPLSFLGPFILATIFSVAAARLGAWFNDLPQVSWTVTFCVLAIIMVPLLFRLEIRSGGEYLNEALRSGSTEVRPGRALIGGPAAVVGAGAALAANPRRASAWVVDGFLMGQRMVVSAIRQIRPARRLRNTDLGRAAGLLAALKQRSEGVNTSHLLGKTETLDDLLPVLAYLTFHGWIGVRDEWDYVWLWSEARDTLDGK